MKVHTCCQFADSLFEVFGRIFKILFLSVKITVSSTKFDSILICLLGSIYHFEEGL